MCQLSREHKYSLICLFDNHILDLFKIRLLQIMIESKFSSMEYDELARL
jgi:hypothetical protein